MHFNKTELSHIACLPSHDFNKEGILTFLEKQDGLFKRNEVNIERWCRLRGNLLFYFKSNDPCSDPLGVIVLENYQIIDEESHNLPYSFTLVCEGSRPTQIVAALSSKEKSSWIAVIQRASFHYLKNQIDTLLKHIRISQQNQPIRIEKYRMNTGATIDLCKPPLVEMSVSCDNLRCNGNGIPPNPRVSVFISKPPFQNWIFYGQTEVMESTSNPNFLSTINCRACDGIDSDTRVCFIVCDIRERITDTTFHLGKTMITIQDLIEAGKTRLFLLSPHKHTVGFITLNTWVTDLHSKNSSSKYCHTTPKHESSNSRSPQMFVHRRTQSLPPRLSSQAKYPSQGSLKLIYENPVVSTFRFHSGLGGDISAMEVMAEPFLCFKFPQQLLRLWINEEKLYLEEMSSLGELSEDWSKFQIALQNQHSTLINMYGIALSALENSNKSDCFFKKSVEKEESALEFVPINLHLQRLFAQNESLRRSEFYDVFTVGAFCANSLGFKNGGLHSMLQNVKSIRSSTTDPAGNKEQICEDIVENLRRLRKDIILLLRLVLIALQNKEKDTLSQILDQLQDKTTTMFHLLEPRLITEAFEFLDTVRVPQSPPHILTLASKDYSLNNVLGYACPDQALEFELSSPIVRDVFDKDDQSQKPLVDFSSQNGNSYKTKLEEGLSEYCINSCYKSTDEPEPWDLIQLNIRASLICLSSKIKTFCDKISSVDVSDYSSTGDVGDVSTKEKGRKTLNDHLYVEKTPSPTISTSTFYNDSKVDSGSGFVSSDVSPCDEDSGIVIDKTNCDIDKADCLSDGNLSAEEDKKEDLPMDISENNSKICSLDSDVLDDSFINSNLKNESPTIEDSNKYSIHSINTAKLCDNSNNLHNTGNKHLCAIDHISIPQKFVVSGNHKVDLDCCSGTPTTSIETNQTDEQSTSEMFPKPLIVTSNEENRKKIINETPVIISHIPEQITLNKIPKILNDSKIDWVSEVTPSMKKLRQAIDGLMRTARLTNSVFRLKGSLENTDLNYSIKYRRDVCFSQALTSVVTGLLTKIWCRKNDSRFATILTTVGPLVEFEVLLSCYRADAGRLADMIVAVEDLKLVDFIMVPEGVFSPNSTGSTPAHQNKIPTPRVVGTRSCLRVILPVPEQMLSVLPCSENGHPSCPHSFRVTPILFNIGINEEATLAAKFNKDTAQFRNNHSNFDRLVQYYNCYKKIFLNEDDKRNTIPNPLLRKRTESLSTLMCQLHDEIFQQKSKNVAVLQLSSKICRVMGGIRFTSCKSAKDRTSMSVTLEQANILKEEFDLSKAEFKSAVECMRLEGTRRANSEKNTGKRCYAFSSIQLAMFPHEYKPPPGSFGSNLS